MWALRSLGKVYPLKNPERLYGKQKLCQIIHFSVTAVSSDMLENLLSTKTRFFALMARFLRFSLFHL
jgi:hypothetical protein